MRNLFISLTLAAAILPGAYATNPDVYLPDPDSPPPEVGFNHLGDTLELPFKVDDLTPDSRFTKLSDKDFSDIAEEIGVEIAAIKAVVDIEAGKAHEGFYEPGKPIINFDLGMYRKFAPRRGVSLVKARKKAPVIFGRPDRHKYGSYQAAQYARLNAACEIDSVSACESAFWGMFQIGGFNWKLCGCESVTEFVDLMSRSERDQLKLFAKLITNCGMLEPLQKKEWLKFAMKYNGVHAKARGYHRRMASSYNKYKEAEKNQKTENK